MVIPYLIASDKAEVLAAARSPEKAKDLGVPAVYLDLDKPESIAPALEGIDRAFLATGYTIDMMRQSKDFLNGANSARTASDHCDLAGQFLSIFIAHLFSSFFVFFLIVRARSACILDLAALISNCDRRPRLG